MKDGCGPIRGVRQGGSGARPTSLGTRAGAACRPRSLGARSAAARLCWLWTLQLDAAINRHWESVGVQSLTAWSGAAAAAASVDSLDARSCGCDVLEQCETDGFGCSCKCVCAMFGVELWQLLVMADCGLVEATRAGVPAGAHRAGCTARATCSRENIWRAFGGVICDRFDMWWPGRPPQPRM